MTPGPNSELDEFVALQKSRRRKKKEFKVYFFIIVA
jgi:hypothetical protein